MRNLQVTDPTINTLNVRWDPAEGNVREYIVIYTPEAGGEQDVVRHIFINNPNHVIYILNFLVPDGKKKTLPHLLKDRSFLKCHLKICQISIQEWAQ